MAKKAKAYVLDTWAVIAYLEDEPSGEQVEDLIATAHEEQIPIYMSVINVGEVWYTMAREASEEDANDSVKSLRDLRIQFVDVDLDSRCACSKAGWTLPRSRRRPTTGVARRCSRCPA